MEKEPMIFPQGRAQLAGPDQDGRVLHVDAQKLTDGRPQAGHRVAGLGLALVADDRHVLAHLGVVHLEEVGQVAGGDELLAFLLQLQQDLVVVRDPPQGLYGDHILGLARSVVAAQLPRA
jgi:hypothetical protein